MAIPKRTTKVDADELHNAMRRGALTEIVGQIVQTQIGFVLELPGFRDSVRKTLRDSGMESVTERFLIATYATYVKTFGAPLPPDLREPFKTEFRKHAAQYIEGWLASDEPKS